MYIIYGITNGFFSSFLKKNLLLMVFYVALLIALPKSTVVQIATLDMFQEQANQYILPC